MKRLMRKTAAGILFLLCLITGCSKEQETNAYYESPFGIEPNLSYEVPTSAPKVRVNLEGYDVKGKKTITFYADELTDTFEILDCNTDEVVYTGIIKKNAETKDSNSASAYGYFTELEKTGSYYIRTGIIGESYPFEIKEDARNLLFAEVNRECYDKWKTKGSEEEVFYSLPSAILAFELYGKVFRDDLGVAESNNAIPDIVDGIKECITIWKEKKPEEYKDAESAFMAAGIFAKFANIYRQYDTVYAAQCTQVSEQIWKYYAKEAVKSQAAYFAAAELYRLTGYRQYHNVIIEEEGLKEEFYGNVTYLSTRRKVNVSKCDEIMKEFMEGADDIYQKKGEGIYLKADKNIENMLSEIERLAVIDHIVTSHEYMTIIENQLNYLLGCNWQGKNYKEELKSNSNFLFMMSAIIENKLN